MHIKRDIVNIFATKCDEEDWREKLLGKEKVEQRK